MGWAWETREGRGRGCVGDNKPDASAVSGGTGLQVHSMGADLCASFECQSRGQTQGTISDKGAPTTPLHAGRHQQGIRSRTPAIVVRGLWVVVLRWSPEYLTMYAPDGSSPKMLQLCVRPDARRRINLRCASTASGGVVGGLGNRHQQRSSRSRTIAPVDGRRRYLVELAFRARQSIQALTCATERGFAGAIFQPLPLAQLAACHPLELKPARP
ncbi:predicted protein [Verticillium alfalfae VaMs.102]|uniref:Predicted protein n=1 Tax=Verticillium alfalfae (strain VaMs.102 / ATCC MYA-4576 / FGSC 10136) TaxID=526221 RepID=C9SP52_VERA1|nr:predicted protein [Verticillium alfalfae VaMs.102]EEY20567.1 predicted protein [Verticillium alfalfae VaMs.102]